MANFSELILPNSVREAFLSEKTLKLGIWHLGGWGRQKIKKVPRFSWEKFKIREIKKVSSSRGYQRLKNNDSFSSYEDPKT